MGTDQLARRWLRGGFPRSYLAPTDATSLRWRDNFVDTFVRRDLPDLGVRAPPVAMHRLWTMLAHQHGQVLNTAALARAMDIKQATISRYVDLLVGSFVLLRLQPWFANSTKRQVKRPKLYLADSGLLHALVRVEDRAALLAHPVAGASWEGFALVELLSHLETREGDRWFWATHAGAELDLLVTTGGARRGFELKLSSTPRVTRSMRTALRDLALDSLDVVHPGPDTWPLADGIRALSLRRLREDLAR